MTAFGETVVQHARTVTGQDADGNDVYGSTDTIHARVTLYPLESVELVQGQTTNIVGLVAVFRPPISVTATDRFTVRGTRWEVNGEPGQFVSPLTAHALTKVNLTRVTG